MSQYPPPPQADQQHYAPMYAAAAGAQLVETAHQEGLQLAGMPGSYPPPDVPVERPGSQDGPDQQMGPEMETDAQKSNRMRKACDMCSARKVKCDESGPPCQPCASLNVECTFNRPTKRRGPPNRHAEALKKRKAEDEPLERPAPEDPRDAAHALAALSSYQALSAESICPREVMHLLLNDYFVYIHPLAPFPHQRRYMEAFNQGEDYRNGPFLALTAAMIGMLVTCFPRKPWAHLKAHGLDTLYPNHLTLINRCQQLIMAARGPAYLERTNLDVYDACTSYMLALMGGYLGRFRQCFLYFGECLSILRTLGIHKTAEQYSALFSTNFHATDPHEAPHESPANVHSDLLTREIARRLFWACFVGARSIQQIISAVGEVPMLPNTSASAHPPFPLEVDDEYIYPTHIEPQPPDVVPLIRGFNLNCHVFAAYEPLTKLETAYGADEIIDWNRQKTVLEQCLHACIHALDSAPPEMQVTGFEERPSFSPPGYEANGQPIPYLPTDPPISNQDSRRVQFEIMKANIHASHLSTRSYLVEKCATLCTAHEKMLAQHAQSDATPADDAAWKTLERDMGIERDNIIKELLILLGSVSPVNMEPNASSFTGKVRQIAGTLHDCAKNQESSVAVQAEEYLGSFIEILVKLDHSASAHEAPETGLDEDVEIRKWADFRDYQGKFVREQGFAVQGDLLNTGGQGPYAHWDKPQSSRMVAQSGPTGAS